MEEIEKALPNAPLVGLVRQTIATGDKSIDDKINHARNLFFLEPRSKDRMRSACETLAFILEPLRGDLGRIYQPKDVSDFFQIVNTFDIRHNEEGTKQLVHEEQYEWIFYSLLNTINTYFKLIRRLGG